MRKFKVAIAIIAAALGVIIVSCGEKNNPSGPSPRDVIFHEDFEGPVDTVLDRYYPPIYWEGKLSISNRFAHSGKQSLTSDSNNTGLKSPLTTSISDSIAGVEFYLYATQPQGTNFVVALAQAGSSPNGLSMVLGMGIDKSDSIKLFYQQPYPDALIEKNLAPLVCNKWNKCNVEYNFKNSILTCLLNDAVLYAKPAMNPMMITHFAALRDSTGSQGPKNYYVDDVTIYKR